MKFRNIVFLFIILVIAAAAFTKPSGEKFNQYYKEQYPNITSPPVIEYTNSMIYSVYKVTNVDVVALPDTTQADSKTVKAVARPVEKYIGLFGRFWRL